MQMAVLLENVPTQTAKQKICRTKKTTKDFSREPP
jgi:hypothetical protein